MKYSITDYSDVTEESIFNRVTNVAHVDEDD